MANAYLYILHCADGSFYVGSTTRLDLRLEQHHSGNGPVYTRRRGRRPLTLVYVEEFESITQCFLREKQVQGWSRAKRIALIEQRFEDLPGLAERYSTRRRRERGSDATSQVDPPSYDDRS